MLINVTEELYGDDTENNPYDGELNAKIGFTAAVIAQMWRELGVPIKVAGL